MSSSPAPQQNRNLSSPQGQETGGQQVPIQQPQPEVNRTMSIEMADVSNLSIQPDGIQGSTDEDRIREKAREAQELVSC